MLHTCMIVCRVGEEVTPPQPGSLAVLNKALVMDVTGSYPLLTAQVAFLLVVK